MTVRQFWEIILWKVSRQTSLTWLNNCIFFKHVYFTGMSGLRRATVMLIMFYLFSEIMFESFNIPGLYIAVQVRFIILFCSKLVLISILQSFVFSIEKLITIMMMTILLLLLLLYFFYFRGWKTFPIKYTKKGIWGLKSCHIAINISFKSLYFVILKLLPHKSSYF